MTLIERMLEHYGGIATTRELIGAGCNPETLRILARFGLIIHIRRGWWGVRQLSPDVLAARRAGGRLACVSALRHHGVLEHDDGMLHMSLGRSGKSPHDSRVVVHWSRRAEPGDRQAVSERVAQAQARVCRSAPTGTL